MKCMRERRATSGRPVATILVVAGLIALGPSLRADWVEFVDETSTLLVAASDVGADDVAQKAYAWGDVDLDGDIDLVVVRKQAWASPGKRTNRLLINEGGVLTDRTAELATDSAQTGDLGFLTPTNDRHGILVDVDLDGWLDLVTATTISLGDPKYIGHPRVYRNKGCSGECSGTRDWLGFRYEPDRIPTMLTDTGQSGFNPCFIHVDAGDVNGDGYPDLWFLDSSCGGVAAFNNKLLLNLGAADPGYFVDVTETDLPNNFHLSEYATSGWVEDMNGDGFNDLVQQSSGTVDLAYNSETDAFGTTSTPYNASAYFVSTGDLNNDQRLDLVVTDDVSDRYLVNDGTSVDEVANFITFTFSFSHSGLGGAASDDGFGGNNHVADLDNDGWNDVLITDVDSDVAGCSRRMHIYRNLGYLLPDELVLEEYTTGTNCEASNGNPPSCLVANIPSDELEGTHDVAVFDVNGDGWRDLVVGRCVGTQVYINQPPGRGAGSLDVDSGPGWQLRIAKNGQDLALRWGDSCVLDDTDYAIYQGPLADLGQHAPSTCSTAGATHYSFEPLPGSVHLLVVPHNGIVEGSAGATSSGAQRPQGFPTCLARYVAECP